MEQIYKQKRQDGITTIEVLIIIVVVIPAILFICDMFMWGIQSVQVSQTTSVIARNVGIQGGYLSSAPEGYPGGDAGYISINKLHNFVSRRLQWSSDWTLKIGGNTLSATSYHQTAKFDYTEDILIVLKVPYKWKLLSAYSGRDIRTIITSSRATISEWKYNYDNWLGE